jgi:hypothetical protein
VCVGNLKMQIFVKLPFRRSNVRSESVMVEINSSKLSGYCYAPPDLILYVMRFFPHCIAVFRVRVMKNSDYFPVLQEPIDLSSENISRSLWSHRLRRRHTSCRLLGVRTRVPSKA